MTEAINTMALEIAGIAPLHSFWLYGSVVLNDFRLGWSDIDFIALTADPITESQAEALLMLRQRLSARYPANPYYRCFEGVIVSLRAYRTRAFSRLLYWGTTGQRITDKYPADPFAQLELAKYGKAVCGEANREIFSAPTQAEIVAAIRNHLQTVRTYAARTDESLYSCGWLLDIARCVYTLRTGDVTGKTQAGEWALDNRLFPDESQLRKTLTVRRNPLAYKDRPDIRHWLSSLGPTVQRYADVLEGALEAWEQTNPSE